jgi:hypothetical protein
MSGAARTWVELNGEVLAEHVERMRTALVSRRDGGSPAGPCPEPDVSRRPAAIDLLVRRFALSAFERDVLLLCAAAALDDEVCGLCAEAQDDSRAYPTFGLALSTLVGPHWSALVPAAPLRRWRLVDVAPGFALAGAPLEIDERILHHLRGIDSLDERLAAFMEPAGEVDGLPPSRTALARRLADRLAAPADAEPLVLLTGSTRAARRDVAAAACSDESRTLYVLSADALPANPVERASLRRLSERETVLTGCAFLVECRDPAASLAAAQYVELLRAPTIVSSDEPIAASVRAGLRLELFTPSKDEQRDLWKAALRPEGLALNGELDRVVAQFDLEPNAIDAAAQQMAADDGDGGLDERLWKACRAQARARLEDLAQRIEPVAGWDDLVLPPHQHEVLHQLTAHVRHRTTVYETWGFAAKSARGLGIAALFSGPSGTGKTMAAEVVARALALDLYRIDLSSVVSKYIGETEKNLRRVFDAAQGTGAILLFDEADALFGSRSEVRDSHDRYANIEVSYLLQRVECYSGLALLTTNLRNAIDPAFLRRFRFVVEFPFPDMDARTQIWRRVFPSAVPLGGMDLARFAHLDVAGGSIRNIALGAAFLAADAGQPVQAEHVERAVREEYAKLERPLPDLEAMAWS